MCQGNVAPNNCLTKTPAVQQLFVFEQIQQVHIEEKLEIRDCQYVTETKLVLFSKKLSLNKLITTVNVSRNSTTATGQPHNRVLALKLLKLPRVFWFKIRPNVHVILWGCSHWRQMIMPFSTKNRLHVIQVLPGSPSPSGSSVWKKKNTKIVSSTNTVSPPPLSYHNISLSNQWSPLHRCPRWRSNSLFFFLAPNPLS